MPHVHLKEKTIVEMPFVEEQGRHETECTSCTKVNKDDKDLVTEGCAGEYVRATAYIYAPAYQNSLVIPRALNLADAMNRAQRCGGDPRTVVFYTPAASACAPYLRCNL